MSNLKSRLDPAFLEKQRQRLTRLRNRILVVKRGEASEEAGANAEVHEQAHEFEDDAQRLAELELQGNLEAVDDERLTSIERALQKIDDGTYGLSDSSGAPIAIERLEANPEALYTLEEQRTRDARR